MMARGGPETTDAYKLESKFKAKVSLGPGALRGVSREISGLCPQAPLGEDRSRQLDHRPDTGLAVWLPVRVDDHGQLGPSSCVWTAPTPAGWPWRSSKPGSAAPPGLEIWWTEGGVPGGVHRGERRRVQLEGTSPQNEELALTQPVGLHHLQVSSATQCPHRISSESK